MKIEKPPQLVPVTMEQAACFRFVYLLCFYFNLKYSILPIIRKLVIRNANYPERLGTPDKFVENFTKINYIEITGYRINYSTVLRLVELQIRRVRKV